MSHSHAESKENISKNDQLSTFFYNRSDYHSNASRLWNWENINKYENITRIVFIIYFLFFLHDEAAWNMQQHQWQTQYLSDKSESSIDRSDKHESNWALTYFVNRSFYKSKT